MSPGSDSRCRSRCTALAHEVDVHILEAGGGVRPELLVSARGRGRGGSGWARVGADGVSLAGAYVPEMFSSSGATPSSRANPAHWATSTGASGMPSRRRACSHSNSGSPAT